MRRILHSALTAIETFAHFVESIFRCRGKAKQKETIQNVDWISRQIFGQPECCANSLLANSQGSHIRGVAHRQTSKDLQFRAKRGN